MANMSLDIYPDAHLLIPDLAESTGGTWSAGRMYPGLHSNKLVGSHEYSDISLNRAPLGIKSGEHIPGPKLHQYLQSLAADFNITRRTKLNAGVEIVERSSTTGWIVICRTQSSLAETVRTKKLALATGLTNNPFVPKFSAKDTFKTLIFQVRYLKDRVAELVKSAKIVVVIGGSRSSDDTAYAFVSRGVITVHWISCESGRGVIRCHHRS